MTKTLIERMIDLQNAIEYERRTLERHGQDSEEYRHAQSVTNEAVQRFFVALAEDDDEKDR